MSASLHPIFCAALAAFAPPQSVVHHDDVIDDDDVDTPLPTVYRGSLCAQHMQRIGHKTHPLVVDNGRVKEWDGDLLRWMDVRKATEYDWQTYPTVIGINLGWSIE